MSRIVAALGVLVPVFLAGCAGPAKHELQPPEPIVAVDSFVAAEPIAADSEFEWIVQLGHSELAQVVREAWERNPGLARMAARLDQAEAEAISAGAVLRPHAGVSAEVSRQDATVPGFGNARQNRRAVSGNVSWELDLWGRLRDGRDGARQTRDAVARDFEAAKLSLAAAALRLWIDLAEAESQVLLAEATLGSFATAEQLVDRRFRSGVADSLDVRLARGNTATARSVLESRKRQRDGLARALETLLGRYPEGALATGGVMLQLLEPVLPGLPSQLLERRPDLRASAARYAAAVYGLSVARKARLPELRLTAAGGYASNELGDVLRQDNVFWNLVAGLAAPVFDGGRITAERRQAEARVSEAAHAYAEAVLTAFREVETALAAEVYLRAGEAALESAAEESRTAERLATERYERGLAPLTTVLEAQRRAFESDSQLIRTRAERHRNRVDLILALGGEFANGKPSTD